VPQAEKRAQEAQKMGFKVVIGPTVKTGKKIAGLTGVSDLRAALNQFLSK
jgi:predicted ATP-dependent serine protease